MIRLALFLGTNLAIVLLISITFRLLGLEGLLQQNGIDLDIHALIIFSAIIGFAGSLISLLLSKQMAKATMRVRLIEEPRTNVESWLLSAVSSQAKEAGIKTPEVGIFDHPSPNAFATGWNKDAALVAVSQDCLRAWTGERLRLFLGTK